MKIENRPLLIVTIITASLLVFSVVASFHYLSEKESQISDLERTNSQLQKKVSELENSLSRENQVSLLAPNPALPSLKDLPSGENWSGYWESVTNNSAFLVDEGFSLNPPKGFLKASRADFYGMCPRCRISALSFTIIEFDSREDAENVFKSFENLVLGSPYENEYEVPLDGDFLGVKSEWMDMTVFKTGNLFSTVQVFGDNILQKDSLPYAEILVEKAKQIA